VARKALEPVAWLKAINGLRRDLTADRRSFRQEAAFSLGSRP